MAMYIRSIIGKLNYLEKSTRPDISAATHAAARFSHNPKKSHGLAVVGIARYLLGTRNEGIYFTPNDHSFDVYADASFLPYWNKDIAADDQTTARSRHGFIIMYAGCPITWASRMQDFVTMSSTESEYVALSDSLKKEPLSH